LFPAGAAVLIVEDEAFVALDLALSVEDAGGLVIGPAGTIREAMALVSSRITGAILDVHLPDGDAGPILHELMARGIPVVVQTGGGLPARLKEAYPGLRVLTKPNDSVRLVATLCEVMNA
jgi:DNA-binding NtrC family response regulator